MAVVRLSDAVIPEVYQSYRPALNNPELTAFFDSGIIQTNPILDAIARAGGKTGTIPFWLDLDPTIEENQSNDDPEDFAVPNKLGSGQMEYRKCFVNQSYSAMDLVSELAGSNPMQRIRNRFGVYWARRDQRRLISTLRGVYADNVANDAGDMVTNISAVDDGIFTPESVIDAENTMGDAYGGLVAMAVHSQVRARMDKNDLIDTIPDSAGRPVTYYRGKRLIVDDSMPVVSGTGADRVFMSVLFGAGAFGFGGVEGHAFAIGEGIPMNPTWVNRIEQAGHGGGQEEIGERRTLILHPFGFAWIEGTLTEFSPTNADLALAAHWNRVVTRKQVPLAFLLSKA
jgi:hypothetical protein